MRGAWQKNSFFLIGHFKRLLRITGRVACLILVDNPCRAGRTNETYAWYRSNPLLDILDRFFAQPFSILLQLIFQLLPVYSHLLSLFRLPPYTFPLPLFLNPEIPCLLWITSMLQLDLPVWCMLLGSIKHSSILIPDSSKMHQ